MYTDAEKSCYETHLYVCIMYNLYDVILGRRPLSGSMGPGTSQSIPTSGLGSSGSPVRGPSPKPRQPQTQQGVRPPQRSASPAHRNPSPRRAESPLRKTGSSVEYTSTQWSSDEEESETEFDEPAFARRGPIAVTQARPGAVPPSPNRPPGFSGPQTRQQQQPSPAPRQQVKTVISKPLDDLDDDDNWLDSER